MEKTNEELRALRETAVAQQAIWTERLELVDEEITERKLKKLWQFSAPWEVYEECAGTAEPTVVNAK